LEFMGSVTYGIISGLNRVVSSSSSVALIQTDAAINPGNSGGALLDSSGKLIGINSSKIVAEEYESMGFAIPSNKVSEVVKNIISKENSPEPYVGITISEKYTAQILKYYGYPAGAVVLSVYEGSPADTAGIKRGDIITEFNGKQITEYNLFGDYLNECEPGQTVAMKVYRSGKTYDVNVTIAADSSSR
ncbi:MAG: PDZ domain-containing protein, partial [Clostridia bacterium]|nr:PDZ domain-containing protein [Clostridia bacterium]